MPFLFLDLQKAVNFSYPLGSFISYYCSFFQRGHPPAELFLFFWQLCFDAYICMIMFKALMSNKCNECRKKAEG